MKKIQIRTSGVLLSGVLWAVSMPAAGVAQTAATDGNDTRKILFIGDSMTGWLSERLNAYGLQNGFEVSTLVWDGSTIEKWGAAPRLREVMQKEKPDAVFVSLGLNELFEPNPEKRLKPSVEKIKKAVGDRKLLWVGPPSWPGQKKGAVLNDWLEKELGEKAFFRSFGMDIQRQSTKNPHPTRAGIIEWMDSVIRWIPANSEIRLPGIRKPEGVQMSRGKSFVYRRMKENL